MSQMQELFEKVSKDAALQEKFSAITKDAEKAGEDATKEKLVAFSKDAGYDVTPEEMRAFFKELSEKAEGELSEAELDMVAGGKTGLMIAASIVTLGTGCALVSAGFAVMGDDCGDILSL